MFADFYQEEVIALRLYTGCIYMKMNGALRHSSGKMPEHLFHDLKGNTYVSVMHALVSGVIKLSLICILPANGEVFICVCVKMYRVCVFVCVYIQT